MLNELKSAQRTLMVIAKTTCQPGLCSQASMSRAQDSRTNILGTAEPLPNAKTSMSPVVMSDLMIDHNPEPQTRVLRSNWKLNLSHKADMVAWRAIQVFSIPCCTHGGVPMISALGCRLKEDLAWCNRTVNGNGVYPILI